MEYKVKNGDSLEKIAKNNMTDMINYNTFASLFLFNLEIFAFLFHEYMVYPFIVYSNTKDFCIPSTTIHTCIGLNYSSKYK